MAYHFHDPPLGFRFTWKGAVEGARNPGKHLCKDELAEWEKRDDITPHITVDATDDPDRKYNTGLTGNSPAASSREFPVKELTYAESKNIAQPHN